jgi:hypothetical protein
MLGYEQDYNPIFFSEKALPYLLIAFAIVGWVLATGTSKTQGVRLVDIFIYGPYLTYLAFQEEYVFSMAEKIFLLFLGVTTVSYNARNFLKV